MDGVIPFFCLGTFPQKRGVSWIWGVFGLRAKGQNGLRGKSPGALRQGLTRLPRKVAGLWPAWCGGDLGSPRKPAGPQSGTRGVARKARLPP